MGVYIVNFAVLLVLGLFAEHFNRHRCSRVVFCAFVGLQLTLLASVRWSTGWDYNQYYNIFYQVSRAENWTEVFQRREEIGFLFFNRCMSYITGNIIVYLFCFYGLMYGLLMVYVYRYSRVKWVTIVSFLAFDYFAASLCFMRQSMAMVMGLFALEMIKRRNWKLALVWIGIASTFHISALILLVCLAFSYIDFTERKVQLIAVVISVLLYVGCDTILEHVLVGPFAKYAIYLDSQFMNGNHFLVIFYNVFVYGLVLYFQKRLLKEDGCFKCLLPVLFLGTALSIMSIQHYVIERIALYITIYNIQVVAQVLDLFKRRMSQWNCCLAMCSAVLISVGAFAFGIKSDRYGICPYKLNKGYLYQVEFFE